MSFTPRPYQQEAINHGVDFFKGNSKEHAIMILPTGSGKSVVIANIAMSLDDQTLILQPSKEILAQNLAKFESYGYRAGVYSASAGQKYIEKITFATIGSIINKIHMFKNVKAIIVDECDLVNAKGGMYERFFKALPEAKVLGLTATPYRLATGMMGAELRWLTRTRPRIFSKCLYYIQNNILFDAGHLAKLQYFKFDIIDRSQLQTNSTGTDFTDASLKAYYRKIGMTGRTVEYGNRLLAKRKNLLVFCSLIEEANEVREGISGSVVVTGETDGRTRDRILSEFKSGKIRCVINVGVLTVGFDFPKLECILIARSTMSLRLYYQIIGRAMRPHPEKEMAWIVDLGGNIDFFGRIETMQIRTNAKGLHAIYNSFTTPDGRLFWKQLTNIPFTKN